MNKSSALLYYTQPADCWEGALPLGNGRLGAMAYGGTEHEELALNEDTLWSGLPGQLFSEAFPPPKAFWLFLRTPI